MCVRHASHRKTTFKLKTTGFAQGYSDCSFILVFRSCKLLIHVSILIQQTVQSCSNSTQTIQNLCFLLAGGQSISLKCDNFFFLCKLHVMKNGPPNGRRPILCWLLRACQKQHAASLRHSDLDEMCFTSHVEATISQWGLCSTTTPVLSTLHADKEL